MHAHVRARRSANIGEEKCRLRSGVAGFRWGAKSTPEFRKMPGESVAPRPNCFRIPGFSLNRDRYRGSILARLKRWQDNFPRRGTFIRNAWACRGRFRHRKNHRFAPFPPPAFAATWRYKVRTKSEIRRTRADRQSLPWKTRACSHLHIQGVLSWTTESFSLFPHPGHGGFAKTSFRVESCTALKPRRGIPGGKFLPRPLFRRQFLGIFKSSSGTFYCFPSLAYIYFTLRQTKY